MQVRAPAKTWQDWCNVRRRLFLIAETECPHNAIVMNDRGPYRVPSTSSLIAFESAARHGNFSRAAEELHTSQSAISRHMARLEEQLSARLFERSRIGVSLTEAGRRYRKAVLVGLKAFHDGAADIAAISRTDRTEVAVACPDEVSHLFVIQQYESLRAALGEEVRIRILAHAESLASPPSGAAADVILAWDVEGAAPGQRVTIAREAVGAFCSPVYAAIHADVLNGDIGAWAKLTFLELGGPGGGRGSWEHWFEGRGKPASSFHCEVVESHAHALEAAVAGRGIVLCWRHLIGRHVEAGTLVMQGGDFIETGRCFHAVLTERGRHSPLARTCLAYFAGASEHRAAGWDEP